MYLQVWLWHLFHLLVLCQETLSVVLEESCSETLHPAGVLNSMGFVRSSALNCDNRVVHLHRRGWHPCGGDSCGGLQALLTHLSSNLTGWRKQKLPPLIPWPVSCISRGCGAGLQRSSRVAFFRRGLGQAAEKSPLPSCPSSMLCQFDLSL